MPYTTEEGGRLNNFAVEPKVYQAAPPSKSQQRGYLVWGALGTLLVGSVCYLAYYASSVS